MKREILFWDRLLLSPWLPDLTSFFKNVTIQWSFRIGFTPKEGLELHTVAYDDDTRGRRSMLTISATARWSYQSVQKEIHAPELPTQIEAPPIAESGHCNPAPRYLRNLASIKAQELKFSLCSHLRALDLWCATTTLHRQSITKSRNQGLRKSLSCSDLASPLPSLPLNLMEVAREVQLKVTVEAAMLNISSEEEAKDGIREDTLLLSNAGKDDEITLNDRQPERAVEFAAERAQSDGSRSPLGMTRSRSQRTNLSIEKKGATLGVVSSSVGHQPGGASMMTASMLEKKTWTKEEACIAAEAWVKTNALENLRQTGSSQGRRAEREGQSHRLHDKKQEEERVVPDVCSSPLQTKHGETEVKEGRKESPRMESRRQEQRRKLHSFLSPLHLEHYIPRFL